MASPETAGPAIALDDEPTLNDEQLGSRLDPFPSDTQPNTDQQAQANTRGWKFYADEINKTWRKGAAGFIQCGQLLNDAKAELQTDAFNAMVKTKLAFDRSVGVKLMRIAANPILCAHVHNLPPCWSTLYELSQLGDEILKAKLADGTINAGRLRKHATALRKPKKKTTTTDNAGKTDSSLNKAAWSKATVQERQKFLDAIGADSLCEAFSFEMRTELRRRTGNRLTAMSPLDEIITKALRQALSLQKVPPWGDGPYRPGVDVQQELNAGVANALNAINAKLAAAGLDLNNISTISVDLPKVKKRAA